METLEIPKIDSFEAWNQFEEKQGLIQPVTIELGQQALVWSGQ